MIEAAKITAKAFSEGEKRTLTIRAERIDPKHLVGGKAPKITAAHKVTEKHPTHEARFFDIEIKNQKSKIENVHVQLNHGSPADDEARLTAIAEDLLTAENAKDSPSLRPTTYDLHPTTYDL